MGTKNFSNYSDMITFSRASTGTYLDSDGLLKSAAINTPRVEYDYQGNRLGLLVEEARTNNVTNSEACEFVAQVSGTVTTSTTPAPFGLSSVVKRVQASALDSGARLSVSVLVGGDNHSSVYVRSRTGADQNLKITSSGTVGATQVAPASGDWVRLGVTASLGAGSRDVRVLSVGDAIDLDIALPQTELGTFPTSYIPTSGATATRSADVASIGVGAFGYNAQRGTIYADGTFANGDTIVTLGAESISADADGDKDYAISYSSSPSASEIVLNGGKYKTVHYYPRSLTAAQIAELLA